MTEAPPANWLKQVVDRIMLSCEPVDGPEVNDSPGQFGRRAAEKPRRAKWRQIHLKQLGPGGAGDRDGTRTEAGREA